MAQCIWCGGKSLFLSVDKNKLCRNCQGKIYFDLQQRIRIIQDSQKLIEKSKNFNTRIGRIDTLLEHVQALKKYEDKNITTLELPPSEVEKAYLRIRSELIFEDINEEIDKIMNKAKLGLTPRTKMNEANKALVKINERRREIQEEDKITVIEKKEKEIKTFIHKTQLNEYIEEAKKAEFKGQKSKALDKYQEALYFLQKENIDELKTKISELI